MVKMRTLREEQRPQSNDPDYWNVWTRKQGRNIDWIKIADEWKKRKKSLLEIKLYMYFISILTCVYV